MKLKDYQDDVLDSLSGYLGALEAKRQEAEDYVQFQKSKGRTVALGDYCRETWDALNVERKLPRFKDKDNEVTMPYIGRKDGMGRPVPNVCLKVPTGGGKTLLACAAVERINTEYFKKQTGLVLWIVPSDAIYSQTWKRFANREDPYRQMLERASGGRVKLLEKEDSFSRQDVEEYLCVMLLMLQAGAVKRDSKEKRRMFQDSGRFMNFFPEVDDLNANKELVGRVTNLDVCEMTDAEYRAGGLTVKQSLGNVFKLTRPVVVIDEGHKAYTSTALEFIAGHNPRFILELSATPNSGGEHASNVLVNVTGTALKKEQMIKLPINLINIGRGDWKQALTEAKEKLDELKEAAKKVERNEGRYIRPILLIRVERTGKEQLDKSEIHSEHVRKFLVEKLGVHPDQVKVKSAELDELGDEDLLSELSKVRFILTKDALREGWDCPFAYVLAVLSKTTARTALTQMVGRVMRQPHAQETDSTPLNECYVFTYDQEVQAAVDSVRRGLEEEGMGDLAAGVRVSTSGAAAGSRKVTIRRRKEFQGARVFLPYVLARRAGTDEWRKFDYDRDMLSRLDWDKFSFAQQFTPDGKQSYERTVSRVSVENLGNVDDADLPKPVTTEEEAPAELDFPALVRLLVDVIPNPWQAARILEETLADLRKQGVEEKRIVTNRLFLLKAMRDDLREQVNRAGELLFRKMLEKGELSFRLVASGDERLNWELAETLDLDVTDEDRALLQQNGKPLERTLFEKLYQKQVNGLEKEVAWYLDGEKAVRWWHRIAVQQDWHLQGWQRNKVYPDFLACVQETGDGKLRFAVLETKGLHLKGNDDTAYKERLFELLEQVAAKGVNVGELKLQLAQKEMRFELMLENNWRERIKRAVA
ncbi:MAG: DEAD/DEAH box helicase family protein [Verrucomicrobia bacterium]|nr:DEAD/DEAH box helicase family protein [Verrucomicrobiota bacterium]